VNICESKFQEDGKEEKKRQKSGKGKISNNFPSIPGLDSTAKVSCPNDENLAPLASINTKIFQYGQTNFISTNTDNHQWSPGVCLNLDKYEGIFKIKLPRIHHQVNYFFQLL
jgi:hypothetical protein